MKKSEIDSSAIKIDLSMTKIDSSAIKMESSMTEMEPSIAKIDSSTTEIDLSAIKKEEKILEDIAKGRYEINVVKIDNMFDDNTIAYCYDQGFQGKKFITIKDRILIPVLDKDNLPYYINHLTLGENDYFAILHENPKYKEKLEEEERELKKEAEKIAEEGIHNGYFNSMWQGDEDEDEDEDEDGNGLNLIAKIQQYPNQPTEKKQSKELKDYHEKIYSSIDSFVEKKTNNYTTNMDFYFDCYIKINSLSNKAFFQINKETKEFITENFKKELLIYQKNQNDKSNIIIEEYSGEAVEIIENNLISTSKKVDSKYSNSLNDRNDNKEVSIQNDSKYIYDLNYYNDDKKENKEEEEEENNEKKNSIDNQLKEKSLKKSSLQKITKKLDILALTLKNAEKKEFIKNLDLKEDQKNENKINQYIENYIKFIGNNISDIEKDNIFDGIKRDVIKIIKKNIAIYIEDLFKKNDYKYFDIDSEEFTIFLDASYNDIKGIILNIIKMELPSTLEKDQQNNETNENNETDKLFSLITRYMKVNSIDKVIKNYYVKINNACKELKEFTETLKSSDHDNNEIDDFINTRKNNISAAIKIREKYLNTQEKNSPDNISYVNSDLNDSIQRLISIAIFNESASLFDSKDYTIKPHIKNHIIKVIRTETINYLNNTVIKAKNFKKQFHDISDILRLYKSYESQENKNIIELINALKSSGSISRPLTLSMNSAIENSQSINIVTDDKYDLSFIVILSITIKLYIKTIEHPDLFNNSIINTLKEKVTSLLNIFGQNNIDAILKDDEELKNEELKDNKELKNEKSEDNEELKNEKSEDNKELKDKELEDNKELKDEELEDNKELKDEELEDNEEKNLNTSTKYEGVELEYKLGSAEDDIDLSKDNKGVLSDAKKSEDEDEIDVAGGQS